MPSLLVLIPSDARLTYPLFPVTEKAASDNRLDCKSAIEESVPNGPCVLVEALMVTSWLISELLGDMPTRSYRWCR